MDFLQWHRKATSSPPPLPDPLDAARLHIMPRPEVQAYADQVRHALRARPAASGAHDAVGTAMSTRLASAMLEPEGARTMLALSAAFGVGKSTLIQAWAAEYHRQWLGDAVHQERPQWSPAAGVTANWVPVVYLTLLSESRSKDLYAQLLSFIGYPAVGPEWKLALAAVRALSTHRVRMIVVDDAHMLRTASVTGRATLNAVKHLNTELGEVGGVMVMVGAHLADGEALADPQIRARLATHHLSPYTINTTEERRDWQHLLKACENLVRPYLPGTEPGTLCSHQAKYLWMRTQGYVGDAYRLMVDATHTALLHQVPLTRDVLEQVPLSQRAEDGWKQLTTPGPRRRGGQRRAG